MYVLDTNILSELIKQQPNAGVIRRLHQASPETLFTAVICLVELRYGALLRDDREAFWRRVQQGILEHVQVLTFGSREALIAGELLAYLKKTGRPIGLEDVLIGAIARSYGYTVITRNTRDFERLPGVKAEDWFSS